MAKKDTTDPNDPQSAPPALDPAEELAASNAQLREQLVQQAAAHQAQQDQILDYLGEMKTKVETLEAAQLAAGTPVLDKAASEAARREAEFSAEWSKLSEEFADYPAIDILEQRVLVGAEANNDIRLNDEPGMMVDPTGANRRWKLRWFNFANEGRSYRATAEGYIKVRWDELQDADSIATLERRDEFVRMGEQGKEVLHKIPFKIYDYKKRRDVARTQGLLTSEAALRDHLANNVARMAGNVGDSADQAGSLIHSSKNFHVEIKKGETERVTL